MTTQSQRIDTALERADETAAGQVPVIRLAAGELADVVHEAIDALRAAGAPIYVRGGGLVRPIALEMPEQDAVRRPAGATVLGTVVPDYLRLRLAEAATWTRYRARERDWVRVDPPTEIARAIFAVPDAGGWPLLRAIVQHPLLWVDGRYMAGGYHDGLLIDAPGDWPAPAATPAAALDALVMFRRHVRHMPWGGSVDEAVAIAALVTAVMRPVLDAAPMIAYDAPAAGTGKSLLADVVAILATGVPASVMEYGRDPAEASKRLDAMLLAGDPIITIDNIEAPLEGAALCQTLTQPYRRIRVLGGHEVVTVPCTALVLATGNNLVIRGDLVRRALVCRLDAGIECPELRRIDQDLRAETQARRGELVAAAQTIVRAYLAAGSPDVGLSPLGSYGQWSAVVRAPLVWLGLADPAATMERSRGDDPAREATAAVLAAWRSVYRGQAATAADAIAAAEHHAEVREALALVATRRGALDGRALGYWLRDHRDTWAGRLVLRRAPGRKRPHRWYVDGDDGNDSDDQ